VASWEDVKSIALGLDGVEEGTSYGNRAWRVKGKLFAKRALVESEPAIYFTTPHFDGHSSVLVRLDAIPRADLEEAIVQAWHCRRG
jgi:hypothetical protein